MPEKLIGKVATAAAGPVIGGIVGSFGNIASQMIANKQRAEEAEKAYKRELSSIHEMNEYNSPSRQMLRLRAAGLNPMMLANGMEGGLQSSPAQGYPADVGAPSLEPMSQSVSSGIQASLEARRVMNDTERTAAQVALDNVMAYKEWNSAEHTRLENETFFERFGIEMDTLRYNIRKTIEEIDNLKADRSLKDIAYKTHEMGLKVSEAQIQKFISETGMNYAQLYRLLEILPHEVRQMDANTAYLYFQQRPQMVEYIAAQMYALRTNADANAQNAYNGLLDVEGKLPLYGAQTSNIEKHSQYYGAQAVTDMIYGGISAAVDVSNAVWRWANPLSSLGSGAPSLIQASPMVQMPKYQLDPRYGRIQ